MPQPRDVRFADGLLEAVVPLCGQSAPTTDELAEAAESVVRASLPIWAAERLTRMREQTGLGLELPFRPWPSRLLASLMTNFVDVEDGPDDRIIGRVGNHRRRQSGMRVYYSVDPVLPPLVTKIGVGSLQSNSNDQVDPIEWAYDALHGYMFMFIRGGVSFLCVVSQRDGRWTAWLDAIVVKGMRVPLWLIQQVADSPFFKREGEDLMGEPQTHSNQRVFVGLADGFLNIAECTADTAADAAEGIVVGLPVTEAARKARRGPDFRLPRAQALRTDRNCALLLA
jgi:hypothetical protein